MIIMVGVACISFAITRYANLQWELSNHPDYVALIGSFVVGILGNVYSRKYGGTAFTTMLTGILLLVPVRLFLTPMLPFKLMVSCFQDGLAAAGGLADNYQSGQDEYTQSLALARKSECSCFL